MPERLQNAVPRFLQNGRSTQRHLKKSLGTKDLKAANIRATSVIAGFDRILAGATALAAQASAPLLQQQSLKDAEIARMAEALYGKVLAEDEAFRFGGRAFVAESVEWIRRNGKPGFELRRIGAVGWGATRERQGLVATGGVSKTLRGDDQTDANDPSRTLVAN